MYLKKLDSVLWPKMTLMQALVQKDLGIGIVAIPTGLISAAYVQELEED